MARTFQMLIDGKWLAGSTQREVKNKYNGDVLGTIPMAGAAEIDQAIAAAQQAFPGMGRLASLSARRDFRKGRGAAPTAPRGDCPHHRR